MMHKIHVTGIEITGHHIEFRVMLGLLAEIVGVEWG